MPGLDQQRPPPRKTPTQARSVETVKVIVEAAAQVLELHGRDGFSTNAVAKTAGVSIGSLYQYFPQKDALIRALIARETAYLIDDAEGARAHLSGAGALSALIQACVAHQFRRPALARLLDFEEAFLPFDADTQAVQERLHAIVLGILSGLAQPLLYPAEIVARDVMAIIKGMVDAAGMRQEDQQSLAERVRRAVSGYLGTAL